MSLEQVLDAIPHRPPFLWVDEVLQRTEDMIRTRKRVDPDEPVFRGHYPEFPLLPGVLVCEAIYQAGAVLLSERARDQLGEGKIPVLTRAKDTRFKGMVRPGDVLDVTVTLEDSLSGAFHLKGEARVGEEVKVTTKFSCAIVTQES